LGETGTTCLAFLSAGTRLARRIDELRWTVHTQLVAQLRVMKQAARYVKQAVPLDTAFNGWAGDRSTYHVISNLTGGSRVLPGMNPQNSWTSLKRLFDGALFAIFGRFCPK
jgi:hypothetical protein